MLFDDYMKLKERAEEVGVGDDPCLKRLLHLLQFKDVVIRHHRSCMRELHEWERSFALEVESRIKEASE